MFSRPRSGIRFKVGEESHVESKAAQAYKRLTRDGCPVELYGGMAKLLWVQIDSVSVNISCLISLPSPFL